MAPMRRDIAEAKLIALGAGAKLARQRLAVIVSLGVPLGARLRPQAQCAEDACARMQHRPITGLKCAQRRRRRQQHRVVDCASARSIAGQRPSQRPALRDQKTLARSPAPSRRRAIAFTGIGSGCSRFLPRSSRSAMQHRIHRLDARTSLTPLPCSQAARNRLASSRRQKKQGRWPAANAVASSRKNSSVQLRRPITLRRQPRNSQTQVSHAGLDQRFFSKRLRRGIMDDAAIAGEQCRDAVWRRCRRSG